MVIAAFVVACLSVVLALASVWYAHRAIAEAKRSADAAAEVTGIERERRAEEVADAERRRVVFDLTRTGDAQYVLRHAGTDTAYGVHVDLGGRRFAGPSADIDEIESGEELVYVLSRGLGRSISDYMVVSWHHQQDRSDPRRSMKLLVQ